MGRWGFSRKLGAGFAVTVAFTVLVSVAALWLFGVVVARKDSVISVDARLLVHAQRLYALGREKTNAVLGFLLTGDPERLDRLSRTRASLAETIGHSKRLVDTDAGRDLLTAIEARVQDHQVAVDHVVELRRAGTPLVELIPIYEAEASARRRLMDDAIAALVSFQEGELARSNGDAADVAALARWLLLSLVLVSIAAAALLVVLLSRWMTRRVTAAATRVQSSCAELEATASQQATGTKEQATSMSEIDATVRQILASAQQQAENARRVAEAARQTTASAASGDETLRAAQDGTKAVQRQIELVVQHVLDLGRKSQQISGILEVIDEYADQTNILAINASIEAAGAGDAGRRFGVVADEIRKLADRMGASAKEIGALVDDIRGTVATAVMATESGSKAVQGGARQSADVAMAFERITTAAATTTDAAREIELSTRQQVTAMEEVHTAIAAIVQVTREAEVATAQTLQTASTLADLSRDLARLVSASTRTVESTA